MIDFSKMEGHTPGPWSEGLIMPDYNDETKMICDDVSGPSGETICRLFDGGERQYQNSAANAYLIAAAPAMKDEIIRQRTVIDELVEALEAAFVKLEDIVDSYNGECYTAERLVMVESAIKKAKGNE